MKKIIILVSILFVLSVSSLCIISVAIDSQNDTIAITENVIFGDKSIANGIKVISKATYDSHLFWETAYTIKEDPKPITKYTFSASEAHFVNSTKRYMFQLDTDIRYGCDFSIPAEEQEGLARVYKELYDSCEVGNSVSKTIYLKDVYEYYPIRLHIELPYVNWSNNDPENVWNDEPGGEKFVINKFREFFKIPVFDEHGIEISIRKDKDGVGVGIGSTPFGENFDYYLTTTSAYTEDTVFFTLNNKTRGNVYADFSLVPGGYGIYSFNYKPALLKASTGIDAYSLANVYPLEPELSVEHLSVSEDGKYLIMIGSKNNNTYFTVIDTLTMTKHKEIVIENKTIHNVKYIAEKMAQIASGDYYLNVNERSSVKESENFMMLVFSEEFAIIEITENGEYELVFIAKQPNYISDEYQYMDLTAEMVYDGTKLIVVDSLYPDGAYEHCGFYMAIYDNTGLIYYATYSSSLDINADNHDFSYNCYPLTGAYSIIIE